MHLLFLKKGACEKTTFSQTFFYPNTHDLFTKKSFFICRLKMGADSNEICLDVIKEETLNEPHPIYGALIQQIQQDCGCSICRFEDLTIEEPLQMKWLN